MKSTLFILSLGLLVSCGSEHVTKTKYVENPFNNSENERRLTELEQKVSQLEGSISVNIAAISALEESGVETSEALEQLQSNVNSQLAQLTALQAAPALSFIDPCNNGPGYDEILIKTSEGVFAYFEQGNQRFLTKLEPNTAYRTTDGQNCNFQLDTAGNLR